MYIISQALTKPSVVYTLTCTCYSPTVNSAEVNTKPNSPVDLRRVTVLPTSEWRRIQDSVNRVNKQHERLIAAAREREAMHLRSKEVVKTWPNTIAVSQTSSASL